MRIVYSQAAQRDRLRQIEYVEQFSYAAADRLEERIEQHVSFVGRFPQIGRTSHPEGTREFSVQHTALLIRYRVEDDRVLILRILHSAQDWPGRF